ncbi:alcohol dehydrogenase catalytic domain-containing protein [Eubacteriales bacterium OttesenSCG-928-N14]|nr:alcohol dehydrogenase catalytic domain-containing protein [Eubacteriales bacterium OttesenSCG-928-N14]
MAMMKAAVMYGPNDIRVEQIEKPEVDDNSMIMHVDAIGLCGSDIRNLTTDSKPGQYPVVLGHEHLGTVVEVGRNITEYKVGDRILAHAAYACGECEHCLSGNQQCCQHITSFDPTQKRGGYAEYIKIPKEGINRGGNMFPIPEGFDPILAAIAEPLASVYSAQRMINVGVGDVVVIQGAGPQGCFHSELAKLRGAKTVIMTELNEGRLQASLNFGVDHIINPGKEDAVKKVMELTNGRGADKVIVANPSTAAQVQATEMCAVGGTVCFFGGVARGAKTEFDTNLIHYRNIWLYGHFWSAAIDNMRAFELIVSGQFDAKKYITHVLPLDDFNEGMRLAREGEAIKVVFTP